MPPRSRKHARLRRTGEPSATTLPRRRSRSSTPTGPPWGCVSSSCRRPSRPPPSGRRDTWPATGTCRTATRLRRCPARRASACPTAAMRPAGARTSRTGTRARGPWSMPGSSRPVIARTSRTRAGPRSDPERPTAPATSSGLTPSAPLPTAARRRRPRRPRLHRFHRHRHRRHLQRLHQHRVRPRRRRLRRLRLRRLLRPHPSRCHPCRRSRRHLH